MNGLKFNHSEETLFESLGISNEREQYLLEIAQRSIEKSNAKDTLHTISELLELYLDPCETEEERVLMTYHFGVERVLNELGNDGLTDWYLENIDKLLSDEVQQNK